MTTPDVDVAGILAPAQEVGGDSFDYALNDHVLHVAVFDAMGHGLEAATMATVVIAAYRHGRRSGVDLAEMSSSSPVTACCSSPTGWSRNGSTAMTSSARTGCGR